MRENVNTMKMDKKMQGEKEDKIIVEAKGGGHQGGGECCCGGWGCRIP